MTDSRSIMIPSEDAVPGIAIVGLAGRFPGAPDVEALWRLLLEGREAITRFRPEELEDGFPAEVRNDPHFVPARPILDGIEDFDAEFFGMNAREAALTDPQQRLFLECAWEAIENAGYDVSRLPGLVGVFGGSSLNTYLLRHVLGEPGAADRFTADFQVGSYSELLGGLHDFVATRVAYKLDLKGPAVAVQSACSTSLLAVAQACQSLAAHQCDMALAGGVSLTLPQRRGYLHQEGGIASADGHCRPFDAAATGTVFGSGAGVVTLKRLEDAEADGDHIYAVIRGHGVNNDGGAKAGFTAPSSDGQAACIAAALAMAGFDAASVGYVECHGTATPLGDPIEIAGLRDAFAAMAEGPVDAVLGSVKANLGHLDAAAGVTGLIKTALMLDRRRLPPQIHFDRPNPRIDLAAAGFRIDTRGGAWMAEGPLRAGVSAFGVGGTNVHVCLEEAPASEPSAAAAGRSLLVLSARNLEALQASAARLANRLENEGDAIALADAAFTLAEGRKRFAHRLAVSAASLPEAAERLRAARSIEAAGRPFVTMMFPGQGAQYAGMAARLRAADPAFRADVDRGCAILQEVGGIDLTPFFDLERVSAPAAQAELRATALAQPMLFIVELALARWLWRRGLRPDALIGHSLGEVTAACLAGVLTEEQALGFVAARGRLMQDQPEGAMLAVRAPAAAIEPYLPEGADVAAINSPTMCVIAGSFVAIDAFERVAAAKGLERQRLHTSHAFHSQMMDPVAAALAGHLDGTALQAPGLAIASTVTGGWLDADEARDPAYWGRHCRVAVQFERALDAVLARAEADGREAVLVEVGPGLTLSAFARQAERRRSIHAIAQMLPTFAERDAEERQLADGLGALWSAGLDIDLSPFAPNHGRRVGLPTYPFQRRRCWIERPAAATAADSPFPRQTLQKGHPDTDMSIAQVANADRQALVSSRLLGLLGELSGDPVSSTEQATPFLSLGFDSLLLGQLAQRVNKEFGAKITFRNLMRDSSTVEALSARLVAEAPPERLPQVAVPAAPAPAPLAAVAAPVAVLAPAAGMEGVVRDQLAVMQQVFAAQLAALGGAPAAAAAPSPAAASASAAVQASLPVPAPAVSDAEPPSRFRMYRPGASSGDETITEGQRGFIQRLVADYNARTPRSKARAEASRAALADPRSVSGFRQAWKELVYPLVCDSAKGARLTDIDGNSYIDVVNGYGQTAFGHAPDFVVEAVRGQLERGFAIGPQSPLAGEVAETIARLTGNERVTFCNTGSEAVMAAIRVARAVTGRERVVVFGGAYHGQFDEVLIKGLPPSRGAGAAPIASGIPADNVGNMVVLPYADPQALEWVQAQGDSLAAVIVEPVQSRHPSLQPRAFLEELRRIADACGAALVFDEVVTGFRVHPGGMQAVFDIRADLATYGKVVGGGLPIGVLAGRRRFMDALDGGHWRFGDTSEPEVAPTFFAGTFVRHPLVLAAAKAVLARIEADPAPLYEVAPARAAAMAAAMNGKLSAMGLPAEVEQFSSWLYFDDGGLGDLARLLFPQIRLNGVHAQEGFPWFLTTAHGESECDGIVAAFADALDALDEGGLLDTPKRAPARSGRGLDLPETAPLTEPQAEIYLAAQMGDAASCAFNESVSLTFDGALDIDALRRAMTGLVERHDALRVRIVDEGAAMRADLRPDLGPALLDASAEPSPEARLEAHLAEDARTPFDLASGPLARAALVRLAPDRHVLVFTAHHIICDGWSLNLLIGDLAALYNATAAGRTPSLPPAPSFLRHARAEKSAAPDAAAAAFWLQRFESLPEPAELPLDRPRPARKSFAAATWRGRLESEAIEGARAFAKSKGVTLFAVLFTALQATMSRLSGERDIVLTVPMGGQALLDEQDLVGHLVNFLPLRAPIAPGASFGDHLAAANAELLAAFDHQDYTFGTLVRERGVPRSPNRTPLSDIQFNLEKLGDGAAFDGIEAEFRANPKAFANFDLFFNLVERPDGIGVEVDYATDLFDAATIARFVENLTVLLADACRRPDVPIAEMAILSRTERAAAVEANDRSISPFPEHLRVEQLFEAQCERTPDAVAAICGGKSLTYAALDRAANALAHRLRRKLPGAPGRVAIALPRGLDLLVAMLGVLKAGHAYVPLDPGQPAERLAATIGLADAAAVLVQGTTPLAERAGLPLLIDLSVLPPQALDKRPPPVNGPAETAYVIFTSGSTGQPKGVAVPHRAVVNFLTSMAARPGMVAGQSIVAVTTVAFDIAVLELLLPLVVGGRVLIAEEAVLAEPAKLVDLIRREKTDLLQATPSLWRILVEYGFLPETGVKALCGGEPLPPDLAESLLSRGAELWNMYGPTETTVWSSLARIVDPSRIGIGEPIANTSLHVLDAAGQPCPFGVAGELHIGGAGLAEGYLNRPDLTQAAFIEARLPDRPLERLYRTGDLARRRPDGQLVLLGRKDDQVKIRGHRIELGEIEAVLRRHPSVADAAVAVREPGSMHAALLAAHTLAPGATVSTAELRRHVAGLLPEYMLPAEHHQLPSLPRTANGKLDRKALLRLATPPREASPPPSPAVLHRPSAANDGGEQRIAAVWREVLGLKADPPADRRLFELGADSLHVFRMAARFAKLDMPIQARHLMINPSVAELARLVGRPPPDEPDLKARPSLADFRRGARLRESAS